MHRRHVPGPLGVEEALGGPAGQQGQHHLREEHDLELRSRIVRFGQPAVQVRHSLRGDRVALAARPGARFHAHHLDQPIADQRGEPSIDLAEADRLRSAEPAILGLLQVIAVASGLFEQSQQRVRHRHEANYARRVYVMGIPLPPSRTRTGITGIAAGQRG
jgi:hypothetical protein